MEELHRSVTERLRRARQRYTPARRRLVALLARADRPLSIAEILRTDPRLKQSSVYRNLAVLERVEAVERVVTTDGSPARFELAAPLRSHHHHLVCRSCGAVEDFTPPPELERVLHRTMTVVSDQAGFEIDDHRVELVGACRLCR